MGYMVVEEPFARPPERTEQGVAGDWSDTPVVVADSDLGELSWQKLDSATIDLAGLSRLEIDHCHLKNVTFDNSEGTEVALAESIVEGSDLSRLQMLGVMECLLSGAKLVGADLSSSLIRDTGFDGCVLRLANLRMSTLQRVAFSGCTIEDLDAYSAEFEDVTFNDCTLSAFSIDRVAAARVDLRGCTTVGLTGIGRLDGFLVSEHQLFALAPQLADVAGLSVRAET